MNKDYREWQESKYLQLESISCDFGVWHVEKECEDELQRDFQQKRANSFVFFAKRDFGYVSKRPQRTSAFRQSKSLRASGSNLWILRGQNDQTCHSWVEFDFILGDFREGHLVVEFRSNEPSKLLLEALSVLISAVYISYRLDRLRIFSSSEQTTQSMMMGHFGELKEVLLGGYRGSFNRRKMVETTSIGWWNRTEVKGQREKLNYLKLRAERFYDDLQYQNYAQLAEPKKTGIISRFFSGGLRVSWGEGWSRWSKRL